MSGRMFTPTRLHDQPGCCILYWVHCGHSNTLLRIHIATAPSAVSMRAKTKPIYSVQCCLLQVIGDQMQA